MKLRTFEKLAPLGTVIAAAGCPACFPALAGLGSALGLGVFARYESQFLILIQVFVVISMLLAFVSYRRTKNIVSLFVALVSGIAMFATWYIAYSPAIYYAGMAGFIFSTVWNFYLESKLSNCSNGTCNSSVAHAETNTQKATLTCPKCNATQQTDIPQNGCLAFYQCDSCHEIISVPKESSACCVICEYSDMRCPVA